MSGFSDFKSFGKWSLLVSPRVYFNMLFPSMKVCNESTDTYIYIYIHNHILHLAANHGSLKSKTLTDDLLIYLKDSLLYRAKRKSENLDFRDVYYIYHCVSWIPFVLLPVVDGRNPANHLGNV